MQISASGQLVHLDQVAAGSKAKPPISYGESEQNAACHDVDHLDPRFSGLSSYHSNAL